MKLHLLTFPLLPPTFSSQGAWVFRRTLPLPVTLILFHIASTGLVVAAAASEPLAKHTTWILGKTPDGKINPLGATLLWPYHIGLRAKLALQRRFSSEPAFNKIVNNYYIGGWPSEEAFIPATQAAVLDVTCELPLQLIPPAYKLLKVWDTHAPTAEQIEVGVAWAQAQSAAGRPVLVHCAHGHGRSATIICALLIAEGYAKGLDDAEAYMKVERPRIRLNRRQRLAVKQWMALRDVTSKQR